VSTFCTTDGVNLSYIEDGQGRPVVLIHGYTAPAAAWTLTMDALAAAGYRVIAFDRRSHGQSKTPRASVSGWRGTAATPASSSNISA
jgi:non-heme chloroperoxidase